ncbi:protein TESPA1 [Scleropages formosus]|uniref:ITPR-interacting domain-containing protein n=1 Tax=Scleropages formosus TaxID=113540 RepID=A0A8C9V306_SCLFO|nr:protein TESPA1 [Scleropages formosus]
METPSPTDRRQAWVRGSRHWLPLEEPDPQGSQRSLTSHTVHHGCSEGKIESWLRACGPYPSPEDPMHLTPEPLLRPGGSFEDDLSLGAEALALSAQDDGSQNECCPVLLPPPRPRNKGQATSTPSQKLSVPLPHLGHSMASSGLSSMTSRTASSVTEVLQLYVEDAEDTLYQLGFGCDEPQVTARIPARFFSFPSQLRGINFRLFLESQLGRLHQEDPGLSLASRFRQVEVLTAMANAFYSLYSHVSRTPLQKLAPPDLSFSSSPVETKIGPRFFSHIRSEPKSPVERLKDTVSKMCLYTGPSLRSPDSVTSHTPLLRQCSLPDLPEAVFECAASEPSPGRVTADGISDGVTETGMAEKGVTCGNRECEGWGGEQDKVKQEEVEGSDCRSSGRAVDQVDTSNTQMLHEAQVLQLEAREGTSTSADLEPLTIPNLSFETGSSEFPLDLPKQTPRSISPSNGFPRVAKFTHDVICPQIAESVNQMPFSRALQVNRPVSPNILSPKKDPRSNGPTSSVQRHCGLREEPVHVDLSIETLSHKSQAMGSENIVTGICPDGPGLSTSVSLHHPDFERQRSLCRITVTGWEEDVLSDGATRPAGGSTRVRGMETSPILGLQSNRSYLSPSKPPALGQALQSTQLANSFELEEVPSAGEEDPGQPESKQLKTLPLLTAVGRHRDLLIRGDSLQSDSSGYAEEDNPLPSSPKKDSC